MDIFQFATYVVSKFKPSEIHINLDFCYIELTDINIYLPYAK